ncbi:aldo/keto reductase [Tilletiaria anomala UBC 951]|uniref:Aldo/keto reductase n=1 Tax=Tilletiaria anomala (strain ATCC 24038 / CBS 436.72 / UBC 951) TaxID=1037660 RepID=A0A066WPU4_TILAU|nr:aldo/keto reductase [Tilletiaria anomala UBC 951]KDN53024.1 aldo/keto reductase [Tilletiaria anomala UBC 951]
MAKQLSIERRLKLNDGREIPQLGLGVYLSKGKEGERAVKAALDLGYRHIDSAQMYANEAEVGAAVLASGIPREQIFVTSKVWDSAQSKCLVSVQDSVKKSGLGYLDLMLLHSPNPGKATRTKAYGDLIKAQKLGLVKSIGVSNYGSHHIEEVIAAFPDSPPAVNQIEVSPFFQRREIVNACLKHNILVEAYSPLGKGAHVDLPELHEIAKTYEKTPSQLLIRWSLQSGHICLPKSANPTRIKENSDIFDFVITENDMKKLDALETGSGVTWDPTTAL